jgi:MFS transporter, CP family, cyanate transporter
MPQPSLSDSHPPLDQASTPATPEQPRRGLVGGAVLATGVLLIAVNLRMGVASVSPVLSDIRADLDLSAAIASLLTTIPVVAFGAFAFLTPGLARRIGMHRLLGACMVALAAGITLRLVPGLTGLFAGTVLVGAAIAVANVLVPAVIKQDFAHRVGLMMGLYTAALSVGAAAASGLAVPLENAVGGWRHAMALWALPAAAAFLVWIPQLLRTPGRVSAHRVADAPSEYGEPSLRLLLRDRVALALTVFMGVQSASYYATLTWVPTLLTDQGMSSHDAGWMLSFSAFPGMVASLVAPALAKRARPSWLPVAAAVALTGTAYLGLATAPASAPYLWMTLIGLGQGATISLALSYIVWRSPDAQHTSHVSTMAQGFGYLFAGLGPLAVGVLHSSTGGWGVPMAALGVLLVVQLISGAAASRDRHVLRRPSSGVDAG